MGATVGGGRYWGEPLLRGARPGGGGSPFVRRGAEGRRRGRASRLVPPGGLGRWLPGCGGRGEAQKVLGKGLGAALTGLLVVGAVRQESGFGLSRPPPGFVAFAACLGLARVFSGGWGRQRLVGRELGSFGSVAGAKQPARCSQTRAMERRWVPARCF